MIKNKIISSVLAAAIVVGTLPQLTLPAVAEASSGRVEWTGYDMSNVNFSTWDGSTYDTSWYTGEGGRTVHAGTEDDPYLIEDADDLAGLYLLTNGNSNNGDLKVNITDDKDIQADKYLIKDFNIFSPDYKINSVWYEDNYYFYDKMQDPTELVAYYKRDDEKSIDMTAYLIGTMKQQEEEIADYDGRKYKPYYLDPTGVKIECQGQSVVITCPELIEDAKKALINSWDDCENIFYPVKDFFELNTTNDADYVISRLKEGSTAIAPAIFSKSKTDWYNDKLIWDEYNYEMALSSVLNGSFFDVSTATNVKGERISLTGLVPNRYVPCLIFPTKRVEIGNRYDCGIAPVINVQETNLLNQTDIESISQRRYSYRSGSQVCQKIKFPSLDNDTEEKIVKTFIYEDLQSTSSDYLDKIYTVNSVFGGGHTLEITYYFTTTSKVNIYTEYAYDTLESKTKNVSYSQSFSCADIREAITDITFDTNSNKFNITFNGVKLKDGTEVTCTTPFTLSYDATGKQYGLPPFFCRVDSFDEMRAYDSSTGERAESVTTFVNGASRFKLISTSCSMHEYADWYALNKFRTENEASWKTAADPSFSGKYIKLMTDIADVGEIIPIAYDSRFGFSGDLDLNGNVLKNANIGHILKDGRIHNGVIVLSDDLATDKYPYIGRIFCQYNNGKLADIDFIPEKLFDVSIPETNTSTVGFTNRNNGEITDSRIITSNNTTVSLCQSGKGSVIDTDILITHPISDVAGGKIRTFEIVCDTVKDVTIDADRDSIGSNNQTYKFDTLIQCKNAERVEFKDFEICSRLLTPLPVKGNVKDSISLVSNGITDVSTPISGYAGTPYMISSGEGSLINCTIKSKVQKGLSDYTFFNTARYTDIKNCNIDIKLEYNNAKSNTTSIEADSVENTQLKVEYVDAPFTYERQFLKAYTLKDNIFDFKGTDNGNPGAWNNSYNNTIALVNVRTIENCDISIDGYACTYPIIDAYPISIATNSKFKLRNIGRWYTPPVNIGLVDGCIVQSEYTNLQEASKFDRYMNSWAFNRYENSIFDMHFGENCTSETSVFDTSKYAYTGSLNISGLKNSIVSVHSDSDNVGLGTLMCGVRTSSYGFVGEPRLKNEEYSCLNNSIVLLDNIMIGKTTTKWDNTAGCLFYESSGSNSVGSIDGLYVYAKNLGVADGTPSVNLIESHRSDVAQDTVLRNCYANLQFRDEDKNTPVVMFRLYNAQNPTGNMLAFYNIGLKSNTESPQSCLGILYAAVIREALNGNGSIMAKNIYLDIPNAQNSVEPSNIADGFVPGLFAIETGNIYNLSFSNTDDVKNVFTAGSCLPNIIAMSNIVVPNGNSVVAQYYNADTASLDSWNLDFDSLRNWNPSIATDESQIGKVVSAIDSANQVTTYVDNPSEAALTGELAYRLDSGDSQYRRSRNWTVLEEDVTLINPLTNEVMGTIPAGLFLADLEIKPSIVEGNEELNLNPIYKLKINQVENGSVEATGLAGKSTTDGEVYIKQNTKLETTEQAANPTYRFAYATQSFYGSTPSKIPNLAETNVASPFALFAGRTDPEYTINGYNINAANTEITPVFKVARYITVNIDGAENATVIPSALVSTAGESIKLTPNYTDGYTVTDLKLNGEPLTKSSFIMPDEDVVITGKAVPFEGGITKYSVFGFDGVIDQIEHTITVKVPRMGNIANALADIEYVGDFITPSADARVDLTNPVVYTVTYGDGRTIDYTVTVTQTSYSMQITDFSINGRHAKINQATRTIKLDMPYGTDLSNLTPEISYSAESISPANGVALDFRVPQLYTLSTGGMANVDYTVTVTNEGNDIAEITEYSYSGYNGVINNSKNTITLNIPQALAVDNIVPSILRFSGRSITPSKTAGITPSESNTEYQVTAQNGFTRAYNMIINRISNSTAKITKFELGGYDGMIDETRKEITLTVPRSLNLVNVVPDSVLYEGKSIYPSITTPQDFSDDVKYTVVAADNTEVEYTVKIQYLPEDAFITYFELYGFSGDIDQENKTITVTVPFGFDLSNTAPTALEISDGASITPSAATYHDFTQPVDYTVTSRSGIETNTYTVTCTNGEAFDNRITRFVLDGIEGTITDIGADLGTISIRIPEKRPAMDYSNIVPDVIRISTGATINPLADTPRDFANTDPVYTVTGAHSGDRVYTVHLDVVPLDTTAKITHFEIDGYSGTINEVDKTITIVIPANANVDITNAIPVVTWQGESILPLDGSTVDFTDPVMYTVQAEDPDIQVNYVVTVNVTTPTGPTRPTRPTDPTDPTKPTNPVLNKDCSIDQYVVGGYIAEIDQLDRIIKLSIPMQKMYAMKSVVPDEIKWTGKVISPTDTMAVDLTLPLQYTVYAEDPAFSKTYTVKVEWTPEIVPEDPTLNTDCRIEYYAVAGYVASIDQTRSIIQLRIPESEKRSLTNVIPDRIVWIGSKLTPAESDAVNLTDKTVYRVYAEDQNVFKDYSVMIDWIPADKPTDNPDTGVDITRAVFISLILASTVLVVRKKRRY